VTQSASANGSEQNRQAYQQSTYQAPPPQYDPVYPNLEIDADANKVYGVLSYFGLLVLISIFFAPKTSIYARYHSNQGIVLLLYDILGGIALGIVSFILGLLSFITFGIAALLIPLLWLAFGISVLVFMIIGIVNAATGVLKPLPLIGKFTIIR
jgi:hypothetical protein